LRESDARLKIIASHTPDHVLIQDQQLRYLFVINPPLGRTQEDMIGRTDYDFLNKEEADRLTSVKKQVLATGKTIPFETALTSKEGEMEYFDGAFVPRLDESGQMMGLIGYLKNTTERKKAEIASQNNEIRLQQLINSSHDWVWEVDQNGVYTYASPLCREVLGYSPEEIIGKTPFDIMPPDEAERVRKVFQTYVAEQRPFYRVENLNRHKDDKISFFPDKRKTLNLRNLNKGIS
jgi:PAS domain S-box-containing protein